MPVAGPPPPPLPLAPPVPPPPPPTVKAKSEEVGHIETRHVSEEEFVREITEWVNNFGGNTGDEEVILVVAEPLNTVILQNGPMCGIVALAEALEILTSRGAGIAKSKTVCPKAVLDEAIRNGYTKQGEMFSVTAMQSLAEKFRVGNGFFKIASVPEDLEQSSLFTEIVLQLVLGYPLLVPYDADHNHSPSLRKGHAAHWAVVHGLICSVPYDRLTSVLNLDDSTLSKFQILHSSRNLVILRPATSSNSNDPGDQRDEVKRIADLFTAHNTRLVCHQGKSLRTACWKYTDLLASNQNLKEIAPKIVANKEDFIVHEGIEKGLCSKFLLFG